MFDKDTPIIVTGGDTGSGEVVRGSILHIDYEDAEADVAYAKQALSDAEAAGAPGNVIESLTSILLTH